jgi:hypothetical protein
MIIQKPEDQPEEDTATQDQQDRDELGAQIVQLPNIIEPLLVDEFIQLGSKVIEEDAEVAKEYKIFE